MGFVKLDKCIVCLWCKIYFSVGQTIKRSFMRAQKKKNKKKIFRVYSSTEKHMKNINETMVYCIHKSNIWRYGSQFFSTKRKERKKCTVSLLLFDMECVVKPAQCALHNQIPNSRDQKNHNLNKLKMVNLKPNAGILVFIQLFVGLWW